MKTFIKYASILVIVLMSSWAYAASIQFAAPYYMTAESKNGRHFQVIKQSLEGQGYEVMPLYVPIARIYPMLTDKKAQGGYLEGSSESTYLFPSESYVYYLNAVAVSLAEKKLKISGPNDLATAGSVIAFQNASKVLGKAFAAATAKNSGYTEKADQENQVKMLYTKRADVIVLADTIFEYYKTLLGDVASAPVDVQYFLGKGGSPIYPVFTEEKLKTAFEAGFAQLKSSGKLKEITGE